MQLFHRAHVLLLNCITKDRVLTVILAPPEVYIKFLTTRAYDSVNSADHVIKGDLLPEFKAMVNSYLKAGIEQRNKGGTRIIDSNILTDSGGVFKYALLTRHQIPITITSSCGADSADILSMDIRGNVRLCPHTSEKFTAGHINDIKNVKIIGLTLDRKDTHCYTCPVKRLCKSSCPIDFPTEVFLHNCKVEKIWYSAIQQNAFSLLFGEEVELLQTGIKNIQNDLHNEVIPA
jgi:radical SAM protein with 4Fe4S-binding SPASM domain